MQKVILPIFVVLWVLATITSGARADDWSKTYELTGKPDLRVDARDASIHVDVWDQNKIEAHVTTRGWKIGIGSGELEIVEHQQGNAVDIELRQAHGNHFSIGINTRHTELEIHMPRSARVNVHSGDGAIVAKGLQGELDFSTSDGSLELEDVDGTLHARSSDGSVHVSGRFDVLDLGTSDGRIEAEARPGSQVREAWEIRSSDGSVTLRIPGDLAADVELHTSDGSITTGIPIAVEGSVRSHDLHGKLNGGGNRLTLHTSDGSVRLDKF
ncbi:MAG: DUF4097 family beta strand repeat-containing protein [Terriglobales bacterium]|jgi:DUF4097 and DUF4098 domain-containing protein YvlB